MAHGTPRSGSVSVVIAAFDMRRWATLARAIDSVLAQGQVDVELVLAVDHNRQLLERAKVQWPGVNVLLNERERGASATRNVGASAATGELLVFLDDDARARPGWLRSLTAPLADSHVVGVGGGVAPDWIAGEPQWYPAEFRWVVGASYTGLPENGGPVRNVWSENMAVRRADFESVGGFREGFGKVGNTSRPEDTEFCIRLAASRPGSHWHYEPTAVVDHLVPASRSTFGFFVQRCFAEGRGKAELLRIAGADGLSSEGTHVIQVLPRGVIRGLADATLRRDPGGLLRAGALVAGVGVAGVGLLDGLRRSPNRSVAPADGEAGGSPDPSWSFPPSWDGRRRTCGTLDLADGPKATEASLVPGAVLLVSLCGEPVGLVTVPRDGAAKPQALLAEVSAAARAAADRHGHPLQLGGGADAVERCPQPAARTGAAVSVVLCTLDRPDDLRRCLASLVAVWHRPVEVVVVDNGEGSGAVRAVVDAAGSEGVSVRYVHEARRGLSRARNTGWRRAAHDLVAFVDDDEVVPAQWVGEVAAAFSDPTVGCVTGPVLPAELETDAQVWFEQFGGHSKARGFTRARFTARGGQSPLYPLPPFGVGANMAFRRGVLEALGGFDVALGAGTPAQGGEDTLAFTEALLSGATVLYEPRVWTSHYHRRDLDGLRRQLSGYGIGLTAYYCALLARHPRLLPALARLAPAAVRDLRGGEGVRTATMRGDFPREVLGAQRSGMLRGPEAYARGRIRR